MVLVMIVSLGLLAIPVNLLRRSIRDRQTAMPDSELVAEVNTVVDNVRCAEGPPEPVLRVGRLGAVLDIALAFVLPTGTGDVACQDRVCRGVRDGLDVLPYDARITVEFGYDPELFQSDVLTAKLIEVSTERARRCHIHLSGRGIWRAAQRAAGHKIVAAKMARSTGRRP